MLYTKKEEFGTEEVYYKFQFISESSGNSAWWYYFLVDGELRSKERVRKEFTKEEFIEILEARDYVAV